MVPLFMLLCRLMMVLGAVVISNIEHFIIIDTPRHLHQQLGADLHPAAGGDLHHGEPIQ